MLTEGGKLFASIAAAGVLVTLAGAEADVGSDHRGVLLIEGRESLRFAPSSGIAPVPAAESALFALVNESRARRGLRSLQLDGRLAALARRRSEHMYRRGYFSHVDPDGKSFVDRLRGLGIRYTKTAENLAIAPTVTAAHEQALASDAHRRKLLDPGFCRVGVGVYAGPRGLIVTEIFLTWQPYGTPPTSACASAASSRASAASESLRM